MKPTMPLVTPLAGAAGVVILVASMRSTSRKPVRAR
jgi:hypothetical protein